MLLLALACGEPTSDMETAPSAGSAAPSLSQPAPALETQIGTPITFHCSLDENCPEVTIIGDPPAALNGNPSPYRGYGDPSLEYDPATETLWLSYSWLDLLISDPGPPPIVDLGVRAHLAKSDDGGATFTFVKALNETLRQPLPDSSQEGWTIHEVSTLVKEAENAWQILWLSYFDLVGKTSAGLIERSDIHYVRSVADTPEGLGDASEPWIRGPSASAAIGTRHDLSDLPELSDCAVFTEPALFSDGDAVYLATGCIVIDGGQRRQERERVVLLRQEGDGGYQFIGNLLDGADAAWVGADLLEQADLSVSRDGAALLIVTPIIEDADPKHQGCVVYEISDIGNAQVLRDAEGHPIPRAILTADGNGIGPGLCTYDAASETGILLVITTFDMATEPFDIVFSLRATGIHP